MIRSHPAEFLALVVLVGATRIGAQGIATQSPSSGPVPVQIKSQNTPAVRKPCALPGISAHRLRDVVDATYMLQPPLAADAMIRIAAKVASPCPTLAKDLLQRAFDQAESVEPATAYKRALRIGTLTDSRTNYMANAFSLQMDRLSLQSRAVLGMVPLDAGKAIQLFQRMTPPHPPAVSCANAFVSDVSIYYDALRKITPLLKAQKSRNDTEALVFLQLQEVAGATISPVQLPPLAKILEDADLSTTDLSSLLSTVASAVENFPVDNNSFYSDGDYPAVKAKVQLLQLASKKGVSSNALTHAFHDYLDRSLNGPHCVGNGPKDLKQLVILYESFNRSSAALDQGIEALNIPTSAPPLEPHPEEGEFWVTPQTEELLVDAKHLNFDDRWGRYTDANRKTPEWQDRVRHLLNDLDDWRPTDESEPADYYHQRCMLLYEILEYLPPSPLYDRVVATWMNTFAESSLQWDKPAEWYFEVSRFLRFSRKDSKQQIPTAALAPLKNSSSPYLHALGVLAEFLQ
ncbi:MAG: hypothetical protein LAO24_02915 [Acidobacteriia bacterium]|nr:hypothetical protein [Terriglobia bacterium]